MLLDVTIYLPCHCVRCNNCLMQNRQVMHSHLQIITSVLVEHAEGQRDLITHKLILFVPIDD